MHKELFTTRKQNSTIKVSVEELEQFSYLLDSGLDNITMIEISFKEHEKIIKTLQQGTSLLEILSHQKGKIFETITTLSKYLPFKDIIQCVQKLNDSSSKFVSTLLKKCVYPVFMFLFSYCMILFFSHILLPTMNEFADEKSYLLMRLLEIGYTLLIVGVIVLFLFNKTFIHKLTIMKRFNTIQFAIVLNSLLEISLPTSQAMEVLSQYKSVKEIAKPIYKGLQEGKTLMDILSSIDILDPSFIPFFQIGLETNITKLIQIYIQKTTYSLNKDFQRISTTIQMISYMSVGLMIILVYQVMLMPLNMLNTM